MGTSLPGTGALAGGGGGVGKQGQLVLSLSLLPLSMWLVKFRKLDLMLGLG